jgi:hypothetical protein
MAISTCVVSGTIKSPEHGVLTTAMVRAFILPLVHADGTFVADYSIEAAVNASGVWSMTLIETATVSKKMTFEIIYPTRNGTRRKFYVATIPNQASADFDDIATEV